MSRVTPGSLGRTCGLSPEGIGGHLIGIEAHIAQGLPAFGIVGLPGTAVGEARWRVRSAFDRAGCRWPEGRITVGLSPADVPKDGTALDLPIAIALLAAESRVPEPAASTILVGELGLDGSVRPVRRALALTLAASRAGFRTILLSAQDVHEAALVPGIEVLGVRSLVHAIAVLAGDDDAVRVDPSCPPAWAAHDDDVLDLADVRGQQVARFAIEVAAAGGHHVALIGTPGAGKTMLARRMPGLLPPLDEQAGLEVAAIRSAAGQVPRLDRPFIAPHHSASAAAMLGAVRARGIRPGAVTLAHHGVLFLDEVAEFARPCLEGLRQPLEDGTVALLRADRSEVLPASFQLIAAANPCPCGQAVGRGEQCTCTAMARRRYAERLSGPFLDRIDLRVMVEKPSTGDLRSGAGEATAEIAQRVREARERASARFASRPWSVNAQIPAGALRTSCAPDAAGIALLERLGEGERGVRGIDRVARVAWTVADLRGAPRPGAEDIAAAWALRSGAHG